MANEQAADKVRKVTAKLRCLDQRGETVHTRWGNVTFDKEGLAELEVPEDEVSMLRAIRPFSWLAEDHVPPGTEVVPEVAPPPVDKVAPDKKAKK